MKILILSAALMTSLAAPAAFGQNAAYPTADNNVTRSDDVDPSEAPYLNEEYGTPSDDDSDDQASAPDSYGVDVSGEGSSSGESGLGEDDDDDDSSPGAPQPEE